MSCRFTRWISLIGLLLASCASDHPMKVENTWVRKVLPSQSVTAGYFTVTNTGSADDRLLSVSAAGFKTVELHEMAIDDRSVMRMRRTGPLVIAAGETLTLKRGGYHLMLIEPQYAIAVGNDIPLTLTFERAGELAIPARVRNE